MFADGIGRLLGGWHKKLAEMGQADERGVVRGGSWNNNRNNARCAYRNRNEPDNFNNNIGFRLVLSHDFLPARSAVPASRAAAAAKIGSACSSLAGDISLANTKKTRPLGYPWAGSIFYPGSAPPGAALTKPTGMGLHCSRINVIIVTIVM